MTFVNLTPHVVRLNDGSEFAPSGTVARVATSYTEFVDGVATVVFGDLVGLPAPQEGVLYVASALVAGAAQKAGRSDVVSPATGHPACVRKDGQVVSVPGFVRP
jgi:hypothetical protein